VKTLYSVAIWWWFGQFCGGFGQNVNWLWLWWVVVDGSCEVGCGWLLVVVG